MSERDQRQTAPVDFEVKRIAEAWRGFLTASEKWIRVIHGRGAVDLERVYRATLEGRVPPDEGHVLSLRENAT